ncbi:MAG: acyl carrier protein [Polyangiaceae bacterium]|jgi:acyl carrier protein
MRNPSSVGLDDIKEILWSAVQGPSSDRLRASLTVDSIFQDEGIDSLDLVEFFLRLQDRYKIAIPQDAYGDLTSLGAIQRYLAACLGVEGKEQRT